VVRPDLRQVERVVPVATDVAFRHDLHREFPFREIAASDRLIQVKLMGLAIFRHPFGGFSIGPVPDALHRLEVEFRPMPLAAALMKEYVCEPNPSMWRKLCGRPRSDIRMVT
jgi:hypothetical protein